MWFEFKTYKPSPTELPVEEGIDRVESLGFTIQDILSGINLRLSTIALSHMGFPLGMAKYFQFLCMCLLVGPRGFPPTTIRRSRP